MVVKKSIEPSGKTVKGNKFVAVDEIYDRKTAKKEMKGMKTPGIAVELKISQSEQGYSDMPKVKGQKKNAKPVSGKKKIKV